MLKHAEVIDRNVFSLFQSTYCSNILKYAEIIDRNVFSLFQSTYCSNMVKHAEIMMGMFSHYFSLHTAVTC